MERGRTAREISLVLDGLRAEAAAAGLERLSALLRAAHAEADRLSWNLADDESPETLLELLER